MPLAAGATFAGYTIIRLLGSGGMGEVYLAAHPRLPRQDALKVLPASISADSEYRERFNREADIAAALWHPHIVEIHDRGEHDGQLWITMDYVDGTDAAKLLKAQFGGGMPPHQVCEIVTAVANALDYAHQRDLLHRDVKPANILLAHPGTDDQRIMLADFGIARYASEASGLTATNVTVGTVSYAAPEQLLGNQLDGRADQYALAASAYQLLTGRTPFEHSNPAVVISQHLSANPPPVGAHRPDLASLDPVFTKALAKDPKDRFARCADFARALRHRLETEAAAADPDATRIAPVATHANKRPRTAARIAAVLGVLLVAAIIVAAVEIRRADDERPMAGSTATTTRTAPVTTTAPAPPPPPEVTDTVTVTDTATEAATSDATGVAPTRPTTTTAAPAAVIGASCTPVGATATTSDGTTAYCSTLQTTGASIWSLTQGTVPSPTVTAAATDEPLPFAEESPVRVCMQQTGMTRRECREAIRRSNGLP
ncbi:serine/threonine-protein kinase [Mycolicibacterium goodii]|uniref:serine/threonine-protein kinase n=1 Tax=Mycolicibacterium goodii TaxID=134601 RepID=UPI001BDDB7AA|nr:serine/threonine-protein kinase [Mycolicibacterium goodii]MBU8812762.1 serine/threonine protein kinase [Mycolicibacterium goodii]MBU8832168.1 serine/threonine protein kinase [Mycolicibacterium goodii]ULN45188.1 serine/threonine protein kinase [Mycolicibacterium goodii]